MFGFGDAARERAQQEERQDLQPMVHEAHRPWSARRHCLAWAVLFAATILIIGAGARNPLVMLLSTEVTIPLAPNRMYATHDGGNAYLIDLSRFRLAKYADSERYPFRSPFALKEDGRELQPHAAHVEIRAGFGKFSHWNDALFFSSSDGSDPFTNGKSYLLTGKIPKLRGLQYLDSVAIVGLMVLFLLQTITAPAVQRNIFRAGLPLLAAALGASYALQLHSGAARFGVTPDSGSYTLNVEDPARAVRPPGYAFFMDLTSDARRVGEDIRSLTRQGKTNRVLTDDGSEHLRKVVFAQKVVLAITLVIAFLGLSAFLPVLLSAAVTLGVGYFFDKSGVSWIVAGPFWEVTTGILLGTSVLAALFRRNSLSHAAAIAAGIAITLYPVLGFLLYVRMVPEHMDFVMSETLTMGAQLLLLACLCCFLSTRKVAWLYLASVAFGLSIWMRPAAIFGLGMIALAVVAAIAFRRRPSIASLAGALLLGVVLMQAPSIYKRLGLDPNAESNPMMSWSLACFALEVAQPDDVKLMPDATAVQFFNEALLERKQQLLQHDAASGPAWTRLGLNMYQVAIPVAQRLVGLDGMSDLLYAFALPIYKAHAGQLAGIWLESFRHGITDGTRLSEQQPLWWTMVGLLLLVCVVRDPMVVTGSIMVLGHFGHVLVASIFDAPIPRYVNATEFLVVVGLSLVIVGAGRELVHLGALRARVSQPGASIS